ncbi:MAG: hypothetical protein WCI05_14035 [Myxococcales bacterium]
MSALLDELRALYADVDALMAPYSCDRSTDCCRFAVTGREPYPTPIEREAMVRALAARGVSGKRARALRTATGPERSCPWLDDIGGCRVYEARPFGCRTYFCRGKVPRREVQTLARRLTELAAKHAPRDPFPCPLTQAHS